MTEMMDTSGIRRAETTKDRVLWTLLWVVLLLVSWWISWFACSAWIILMPFECLWSPRT